MALVSASSPREWRWPVALAAACVAAWFLSAVDVASAGWLRHQNLSEPWRLLTAHLVHLDLQHLLLNLAGLGLIWVLTGAEWKARYWTGGALFVALAIGLGLFLVPDIGSYVGLSGVLHGLMAMGAVGLWRRWRLGAVLVFAFLLGKAIGEWMLPSPVIVEAHWLGTGAGLMVGIMLDFVRRRSS
jgi:rhomboid family GlyGly-CTERM serine protease